MNNMKVYITGVEAAEFYNVRSAHVTAVCRGRLKHTGGFRFAYYDQWVKEQEAAE